MPTFPSYDGELPECLNPLNLRHYFLLLYWVFFRPTALKCYLYQADPELYKSDPGTNVFRIFKVKSYRNLYLLVPGLTFLCPVILGLPLGLIISWFQKTSFDWSSFILVVVVGVVGGVLEGVAFGVLEGVALGMVGGVALSVAGDMAFGVAVGVAGDMAFGVAVGVAFGVAFGVLEGMVEGVVVGVAVGVAVGVGALHIPFFLLQFPLALCSPFSKIQHPIIWDELIVLPLPCTEKILLRHLQSNPTNGLQLVSNSLSNPFQRWAVQKAVLSYFNELEFPLHFFYTLLTTPILDSYIFEPLNSEHWRNSPTTRRVLFDELKGLQLNSTSDFSDYLPLERFVYLFTYLLRERSQTPLRNFAKMLCDPLNPDTINSPDFDLSNYRNIYADKEFIEYPGGIEIRDSFEAMTSFLSYKQLSEFSSALEQETQNWSSLVNQKDPIRPKVFTAFNHLDEIKTEVITFLNATSRVNQLAALGRATDNLKNLDEYVEAELVAPEQYIIQRIIRQWNNLIVEEIGEVGRAEDNEPVANPYILGNPVTGDLFVGREDIMRRLEELWIATGQCPSVVIYGHRRMGKSSILRNLNMRLSSQTIVVDFNMQRVGIVNNTGELLYNLVLALYDNLPEAQQKQLGEPQEENFLQSNPYTACDRILKQLDKILQEQRFIITIDEFELIEKAINEELLEPRLLEFWRGLIQTYPWFVLAFAGLHTLKEMTQDYWNPLFGSVTAISVSFLSIKAAQKLIKQPSPDFNLDYELEAIELIIKLTNGQPYLIQLICHSLVTLFNRQTFEEGQERERKFTASDVEAVINAPEFYRDGNAYFNGVWVQAEKSHPDGQTAILEQLSQTDLSFTEIEQKTGIAPTQIQKALKTLENHDVIENREERYFYTVELMKQWVAQRTKDY